MAYNSLSHTAHTDFVSFRLWLTLASPQPVPSNVCRIVLHGAGVPGSHKGNCPVPTEMRNMDPNHPGTKHVFQPLCEAGDAIIFTVRAHRQASTTVRHGSTLTVH